MIVYTQAPTIHIKDKLNSNNETCIYKCSFVKSMENKKYDISETGSLWNLTRQEGNILWLKGLRQITESFSNASFVIRMFPRSNDLTFFWQEYSF